MRYIRAPTFCSKLEASHVFHESHHQHAVRVICEHRLTDAALSFANGADNADGWFPFVRHPKGRDPQSLVAEWDRPADGDRLVHQALLDLLPADGEDMPDYNVKVACCQDCNHLMTMEFWFRYHLYGSMDDNEHRLIPTDAIRVQPANAGRHPLREWEQWGAPLGPVTSFPQDLYLRTQDIMSAAVGYYLHRCLPVGVLSTPRTKLYVAMCWVVLEVTCLLCELVKGSLNAEDTPALIKRNKPQKNALGCIELYLSYMAWRVLGFKHRRVRNMAFERSPRLICFHFVSKLKWGQVAHVLLRRGRPLPGGLPAGHREDPHRRPDHPREHAPPLGAAHPPREQAHGQGHR